MKLSLIATALLFAWPSTHAAEVDFPLAVSISPDKNSYRLREKITFTVTVKNTSENPIPVLVRGRDGKTPLGILELYSEDAKQNKTRFDVCSLSCGTFLQNGSIEPGEEMTMNVSISENTTWGPAAPYQFVFRVASAQKNRNEPYSFQASSNVAKVEITK